MKSTLDTIIQEVVDSIPLTLDVYAVEVVDGNYKLWALNTFFLTVNYQVELGGDLYKVKSFSQNEYIVVSQIDHENTPVVTSYTIAPPTYIWGRFNQVNIEINKGDKKKYNYKPFIWRFDLESRTLNFGDEMNASTGSTRLFFIYTTNYKNFTTSTDYDNVLDPLENYIQLFIKYLKKHRLVGKLTTGSMIKHPKFLTSSGSVGKEINKNVFGKYVSAVEITLQLPIRKDLTCRTKFIPVVEGDGFDDGFDDGFG